VMEGSAWLVCVEGTYYRKEVVAARGLVFGVLVVCLLDGVCVPVCVGVCAGWGGS
jgi:hypothetical protein